MQVHTLDLDLFPPAVTCAATKFTLDSLIKTELPLLPGSVVRVSSMLQDPNASQRAIGQAIGCDPILATRVLKLANSPIFALQRTITNLSEAVTAIGNTSISECLLISGIGDSFGHRMLNSGSGREIWHNLLGTAMVAGDLCRLAKMRGGEEAFTCGLLHDLGKLLLLKTLPAVYQQVLQSGKPEDSQLKMEREIFGFDHAELGSLAAASWNLPEPVCHIIRWHHEPEKASEAMAITRIVNLADQLVYKKTAEADMDDLCSEAAAGFGFTKEQFNHIWENTAARIRAVTQSFV